MNKYKTLRNCALLAVLGLLLWAATSALAQNAPKSVRAFRDCDDNVTLDWSAVGGVSNYSVSYSSDGNTERRAGSTGETSYNLGKLGPGPYTFYVDTDQGTWGTTTASLGMAYCPTHTLPPQFNCAEMTNRVVVNAIGKGTNCQSVIPGGIGDPSLIAAGVLDAIDIWGHASNVRFCFLKRGRLVFVDTATSPRVVSDLAAEYIDGMTCGSVDRTGMVLLLRADGTAGDATDTSTAPAATEAVPAGICQLTATGFLSLRAGPSIFYARLDAMPIGTRLLASGRNGDWFLVNYEGQWGWSSGAYLTQSGACEAVGESSRVYLPLEDEPASVAGEAQDESLEAAEAVSVEPGVYVLIDCRLTAGDIINLRAEPGIEHNIEAEIPFRTQLTALDRSGDWFKVEYEGSMGWVNIDYVFRRGACG